MLTAEKHEKEAATERKLYHLLHYYFLVQTFTCPLRCFWQKGHLPAFSEWLTASLQHHNISNSINHRQLQLPTDLCCLCRSRMLLCYATLSKMKLALFISSNQLMESCAFKFPNNLLLSATAAWEDRYKPGIDSKSKVLGSAWAPLNKHHSRVKPCNRTTLGQRKERATWHGVLSSARPGLLPRPGHM